MQEGEEVDGRNWGLSAVDHCWALVPPAPPKLSSGLVGLLVLSEVERLLRHRGYCTKPHRGIRFHLAASDLIIIAQLLSQVSITLMDVKFINVCSQIKYR